MLENIVKIVGLVVVGVVVIIIGAVLTAFPVMLMWNYLMPVVFGLKTISFGQALILSLLCSTLFKSSPSSSKD
jgi:protein-S-isoprenylcysteine O-methyltransferase Ste14